MSLRRDVRDLKEIVESYACRLKWLECEHVYYPETVIRTSYSGHQYEVYVSRCMWCGKEEGELTERQYLEARQSEIKDRLKFIKEHEFPKKSEAK